MTTDGVWAYTYDAEGRVEKRSKGAAAETWVYGYDYRGQLVSAVKSATDGGTATVRTTYAYDAWGNLIGRDAWDPSDPYLIAAERYGLDGWDPAKPGATGNEGFDAWVDLSGSGSLIARRVFGPGFDAPEARVDWYGGVAWYLSDRLGSVRAVTNQYGSVTGTAGYDAFGKLTGGSRADRYGYTGAAWDALVGLQRNGNGARWYDPAVGRWLQPDPLGFGAGDPNLYRYVGNNPTNATDPSGLWLMVSDKDAFKFHRRWGNLLTYQRGEDGVVRLGVTPRARNKDAHDEIARWVSTEFNLPLGRDHTGLVMVGLFNGGIGSPDPAYRADGRDDPFLVSSTADARLSHYVGSASQNGRAPVSGTTAVVVPGMGGYFADAWTTRLALAAGKAEFDALTQSQTCRTFTPEEQFVGGVFYELLSMVTGPLELIANARPLLELPGRLWYQPRARQELLEGLDQAIKEYDGQTPESRGRLTVAVPSLVIGGVQAVQAARQGARIAIRATKAELQALARLLRRLPDAPDAPAPRHMAPPRLDPPEMPNGRVTPEAEASGRFPLDVLHPTVCFVAGTPLLTPEGVKPIEAFRPGDLVLSRPEGEPYRTPAAKVVEAVFERAGFVIRLRVSGRVIETTAEHPFYLVGQGWRVAAKLSPGDVLSSHNETLGVVEEVAETGVVRAVYNLRVADWHTYFVGGDDWGFSVWAHNADYVVLPDRNGVLTLHVRDAQGTRVVDWHPATGRSGPRTFANQAEVDAFFTQQRAERARALMDAIEDTRAAIIADDALSPAAERAALEAQRRYMAELRELFDLPDDAPIGQWRHLSNDEFLQMVERFRRSRGR